MNEEKEIISDAMKVIEEAVKDLKSKPDLNEEEKAKVEEIEKELEQRKKVTNHQKLFIEIISSFLIAFTETPILGKDVNISSTPEIKKFMVEHFYLNLHILVKAIIEGKKEHESFAHPDEDSYYTTLSDDTKERKVLWVFIALLKNIYYWKTSDYFVIGLRSREGFGMDDYRKHYAKLISVHPNKVNKIEFNDLFYRQLPPFIARYIIPQLSYLYKSLK